MTEPLSPEIDLSIPRPIPEREHPPVPARLDGDIICGLLHAPASEAAAIPATGG